MIDTIKTYAGAQTMDKPIGMAKELLAVEMLEYHNKNWLQHGVNPRLLSEQKISLLTNLICELTTIGKYNTK